jgi:hypothetical protein
MRDVRQLTSCDDPAYGVDGLPPLSAAVRPLLVFWCFPLQIVVLFGVRLVFVLVVIL